MSAPLGTRIGPFEIVAAATLPAPGAWFAARRFKHQRRTEGAWIRLLDAGDLPTARRAYRALSALDAPGWPRPVGFFEGAGALAVEAPETVPLSRLIALAARGAVPLSRATLLDLALALVDALVHAHDRGHVHGGLSPDVIGLSAEGEPTIWGLAEGLRPPAPWCPPERARGGVPDPRTDQWSVAALVAALVTARSPRPPDGPRDTEPRSAAVAVEAQWPALGRILGRMLAPRPPNRYPDLHAPRRELLALARRCAAPSERRALGRHLFPPEPAPSTSPAMPRPPRIQIPTPTASPADAEDTVTTRPATPRTRLPDESVPVVRPEVGTYGPAPVARSAPAAAPTRPLAGVRDDLDGVAIVDVEIDDTDPGRPVPLEVSPATDDLPYPSPEDVFGGIDILGGDPADAPPISGTAPPPAAPSAVRPGGGGVTAVPRTDPGVGTLSPGFDPISLDDPEEGFFTPAPASPDRPAALAADGDDLDWEPRRRSRIEQVAQGLLIANACLAALWLAVRVF